MSNVDVLVITFGHSIFRVRNSAFSFYHIFRPPDLERQMEHTREKWNDPENGCIRRCNQDKKGECHKRHITDIPRRSNRNQQQHCRAKKRQEDMYIYGHLPVFHHDEEDVQSFRMFTSQMIIDGTIKPKEIVKAFGVPDITVKRYVKLFSRTGCLGIL